jgi:O-antigen/teichoic acid export membrane protein
MPKLNVDFRGLIHLGKMSGGYFITTIINQALPFLILPVLTRFLTPVEYGNLALFNFYLAIAQSLTGVSVPAVISKNFFDREKEYIAKVIGNSILIVALFSLVTMLFVLIFYSVLQTYLELPLIWMLMIAPASFAFVVFSLGLSVMRNAQKVFTFGRHQITNTVVNLGISLFLIISLMWGWHGRAWGIMLSHFISAVFVLIYLKRNGYLSFKISKQLLRSISKVVFPLIPNSLQSVVISQVGIFFIQFYFTKELLGLYSIGFQLSIPIKLLFATLCMSWFPYLYDQLSNNKIKNTIYLARMFYALVTVLLLGVVFLNVFSGLILRVMTQPDFYGAKVFIFWFTLGFFFNGCYMFLYPILIKNDKQKYISVVSFVNMALMLVFNIVFVRWFGYIGIAYAFFLTYFLMFVAFFFKAQQTRPLPWLKALKIWK